MYHGPGVKMEVIPISARIKFVPGSGLYAVKRDGRIIATFIHEADAQEYIDAQPIMECRRCGFTNGCAPCEHWGRT